MTNQSIDYCSLIVHKRRTVSAEKRVAIIICWSVSSAVCLAYPVSCVRFLYHSFSSVFGITNYEIMSPKNVSLRSVKQKVKISCFKFQRTHADGISSSVVWRNQLNLLS